MHCSAHTICHMQDVGLDQQVALIKKLEELGQEPIVLVNEVLLRRPEGTLRALCQALQIPFQVLPSKLHPVEGLGFRLQFWDVGLRGSASFFVFVCFGI